jgi:hypothetical protein
MSLKRNYQGCAICDSTWGNLYEEVEGERTFFCCSVCAIQFRRLVERLRKVTGWGHIDTLTIEGDRRGRTCSATSNDRSLRFFVAFNTEGDIRRFTALPASPA